jgi:hypothetical protein
MTLFTVMIIELHCKLVYILLICRCLNVVLVLYHFFTLTCHVVKLQSRWLPCYWVTFNDLKSSILMCSSRYSDKTWESSS